MEVTWWTLSPQDPFLYSTFSCVNGIFKHPEIGASVNTIENDAFPRFVAALVPLNSEPRMVWGRRPATHHPCQWHRATSHTRFIGLNGAEHRYKPVHPRHVHPRRLVQRVRVTGTKFQIQNFALANGESQ